MMRKGDDPRRAPPPHVYRGTLSLGKATPPGEARHSLAGALAVPFADHSPAYVAAEDHRLRSVVYRWRSSPWWLPCRE